MALSHAALDGSAVCDFGISWSYSPTFCNAGYRRIAVMGQYLTAMSAVLILVKDACRYQICIHSAVVIHARIQKVLPEGVQVNSFFN